MCRLNHIATIYIDNTGVGRVRTISLKGFKEKVHLALISSLNPSPPHHQSGLQKGSCTLDLPLKKRNPNFDWWTLHITFKSRERQFEEAMYEGPFHIKASTAHINTTNPGHSQQWYMVQNVLWSRQVRKCKVKFGWTPPVVAPTQQSCTAQTFREVWIFQRWTKDAVTDWWTYGGMKLFIRFSLQTLAFHAQRENRWKG